MINIRTNKLGVEEFCDLQESVGFGRPNDYQRCGMMMINK